MAKQREKSFLEQPEVLAALVEERVEEILAASGAVAPVVVSLAFEDDYARSTAAQQTTLITALPEIGLSLGTLKAGYRQMCLDAMNLAEGGEGLFANFVEQMIESVAGGFENRLATVDLAEIGDNPGQPTQGLPGGAGPQSAPDYKGARETEAWGAPGAPPDTGAPGPAPAPAPGAPGQPGSPPSPAPGKAPGGKAPRGGPGAQQNYLGLFDGFCRYVNADENGRSIVGRVRGIEPLLAQWVYHTWTTGIQCILYRWGTIRVPELNYRSLQVPVEMQFLDPLGLDLDDLRTKGVIWYELPTKDKTELINEVLQYGDPAKHPFFAIYPKKGFGNQPTQIQPVKQGVPQNVYSAQEAFQQLQTRSRLPLPPDSVKLYRRTWNPKQVYPTPFAARIFAPVNDKRMLRAMDRSLIRKVIMMILQVAVQSPDNKRPVRETDLNRTKDAIEQQMAADPEYLQVLATPGDTKINWIIPEHNAILDHKRYRTVDFEILAALVGLVSNQLLNESGTLDMTLIGKTLYQKNQQALIGFQGFLEEIYDEIIVKNGLRAIKPSDITIVFKQISLYESDAFRTFIFNLVVKGMLPARVAIDHLGENYDSAMEQLVKEEQLRRQYNILLVPPTNMQGVYPGYGPAGGDPATGPAPPAAPAPAKPAPAGGRPPGSTDTQVRKEPGDGG